MFLRHGGKGHEDMEHVVRTTTAAGHGGGKLRQLLRQGAAAFCDIETLGLDPATNPLILAACGYFTAAADTAFVVEQFFATTPREEEEVLRTFLPRLAAFPVLVTFNGQRFDVPFLLARSGAYGLTASLTARHFDIYREVCRYKAVLPLERYNLKALEQHLGIPRDDHIDGAASVLLYRRFQHSHDAALRDAILQHNFEDIRNLPAVLAIFDRLPAAPPPLAVTPRQAAYLQALLRRRQLRLVKDLAVLSKDEASWLIDCLLHGRDAGEEYVAKSG